MAPIIKLENLSKKYGSFYAVNHLNLEINKGEIFGLLGPNGAGKSTTILMMLGLTEPHSGQATVCGFNATTHPIEVKKRVGYLPDTLGFYDNSTGLENLVYIAMLNRQDTGSATQKAKELLTRVGLKNDMHKKLAAYSRGMKQRLGLAEVLIKNPEIIILDEPTLGIDPNGVREFLQLIRKLSKEEQLTVLLSSHNLHQVQQVCDQVGLFVDGKLIAKGDIPTLSKELFLEEPFITEVKLYENHTENQSTIKQLLLEVEHVITVRIQPERIFIYCKNDVTSAIAKKLINSNFNIKSLYLREFGLDDIYQRYFEKKNENDKQTIQTII